MEKISPTDLIPMDIFVGREPITIDLVYADSTHPRNIFKEKIYHDAARLWAHKNLAVITLMAAKKINQSHNWILEIKDCLRTYDSQVKMRETKTVKDNPDWLYGEFPMVSQPGAKGHPRAMAIDVCLIDQNSNHIDMGTPFDDMSELSYRDCKNLPLAILENRKILEDAFIQSAAALNLPILPMPYEWWDFRFPATYSEQFAPIHDKDLPPQMQMTAVTSNDIPDFDQEHFDKLAKDILYRVNEVL